MIVLHVELGDEMRTNEDIICSSELLKLVVTRIEKYYREDVDILICYGSYTDGTYTKSSDIDFCFIPKNRRAFGLCSQFIVDGIGYDLWPISWDRIDSIANLNESFASIVMSGVILYANSQQSIDLFASKKKKVIDSLSDVNLISTKSSFALMKLKSSFFNSLVKTDGCLSIEIVNFFEDLLFVLSLINGKTINKGTKALAKEIENFTKFPPKIVEEYQKVIRSSEQGVILDTMKRLIVETEAIWSECFSKKTEPADFSSVVGFYEELKSVYNKLVFACGSADYNGAYYAAYMIDRETQTTLLKIPLVPDYPNLTATLKNSGFSQTLDECYKHERLLTAVLHEGKVEVKSFKSLVEYGESLESGTH